MKLDLVGGIVRIIAQQFTVRVRRAYPFHSNMGDRSVLALPTVATCVFYEK